MQPIFSNRFCALNGAGGFPEDEKELETYNLLKENETGETEKPPKYFVSEEGNLSNLQSLQKDPFSNTVEITTKNVAYFCKLAKQYELDCLKARCLKFLRKNPSSDTDSSLKELVAKTIITFEGKSYYLTKQEMEEIPFVEKMINFEQIEKRKILTPFEHEEFNKETICQATHIILEYLTQDNSKISADKIGITEENVQIVSILIDYYQVTSLKNVCLTFIRDNLDSETVLPLWNFAKSIGWFDLQWVCFIFLTENNQKQPMDEQVDELDPALQLLLQEAINLKKAGISFEFSGNLYRIIRIDKELTESVKESIKKINKCIKINGVFFEEVKNIDLTELLPDIEYLNIYECRANKIPFQWMECLKTISCSDCEALTSLNASNANTIYCRGCKALTSLNAPRATKIDCRGCKALTSLDAPRATEIDCSDCKALTSLNAPRATKIDCRGCKALTSLDVPRATEIDCSDCTALISLDAPRATKIDCYRCKALTSLDASSATEIDCSDCAALTSLDAPRATKIDCYGCKALTSLNARSATKINCSCCTALPSLNAPNATTIDCGGCEALTSLNAPRAIIIYCGGCTALPSLDAPNATTIDCTRCTALTSLNAPNATGILFPRCSSLNETNIYAPKAGIMGMGGNY